MNIFKIEHEKGEYGYLREKKFKSVALFILIVVIAILIFLLGLALNKGEMTNIFTVLAVVMVLPAAKALIACIMLIPSKCISLKEKEFIDGFVREGDTVLYDIVFTSSQHKMHLDAMIVGAHQVAGFTTSKLDNINIIDAYFKDEFKARKIDFVSFITDNEKAFENRMKLRGDSDKDSETAAKKQVLDFIRIATI